jgi:hypothetical protein
MKFHEINPPRIFKVGNHAKFDMSDCGRVTLESDEQLTFLTEDGGELDFARKEWGFYVTPSLNGRLEGFGLRAVLVRNTFDRYYVLVVERGKEAAFDAYCTRESLELVHWLDTTDSLEALRNKIGETD